jgi:hypothetical protein
VLSGELLKALFGLLALPDALGRHASECGHPEMSRLPDGVFLCPACRAEVTPYAKQRTSLLGVASPRVCSPGFCGNPTRCRLVRRTAYAAPLADTRR